MKTKSNIIIVLTIVAVGLVSFFISHKFIRDKDVEANIVPVSEVQNTPSSPKPVVSDTSSSSGAAFVASKNGERYFPVTCGSAKTIKPENAIYFATQAEAEAAGKTKSVQCDY